MKKPYLLLILLLVNISVNKSLAQTITRPAAPIISYGSGLHTFEIGKPIEPLKVTNTGGAIPLTSLFSQTSTIGGNHLYGYVDGNKKDARLGNPLSSARDAAGNIYIADANNNAIRKLAPDGTISTFAGNGDVGANNAKGRDATFNYPTGVVVAASGNIYVADYGNCLIRKITPDGTVTTLAGTGAPGHDNGVGKLASFNLPYGLTVDKAENVYVADSYNNLIRKITPAGVVTTVAGILNGGNTNGPGVTASFKVPYGIAIDSKGNLFVADKFNFSIRKITPDNTVSTFATGGLFFPNSVAVDSLNNVYACGQISFVTKYLPSGAQSSNIPLSGFLEKGYVEGIDTVARYSGNLGVSYDGVGNLLVSDGSNFVLRKVNLYGYQVEDKLPEGLSLDSTGTITGTPKVLQGIKLHRIAGYNAGGKGENVATIQIVKGSQVITFPAFPKITYGDKAMALNVSRTNKTLPLTYTVSDPSIVKVSKDSIYFGRSGTVTITVTQPGNDLYLDATPVSQTLTIQKAPLTITAVDTAKLYNTDNPIFRITYKGFVNKEDTTILSVRPAISNTASKSSPAGDYPITLSGAKADNYTISYVPGTLSVINLPTIAADGSTTFFDGGSVTLSTNAAAGYTYQWFKDNVAIKTATASKLKVTDGGKYTVAITVKSFTATSAATTVYTQFSLPVNNFKLTLNGAACKGSANGSVNIEAVQKLNYSASFTANGTTTTYPFTNQLTIDKLTAGNYSLCISVEGKIYSQCFNVVITEPADLSVYSTVNTNLNTVNLQLNGGSSYNVNLNDVVYTTTNSQITLPLITGANKLSVTTDKLCQGIFEKIINLDTRIIPYPNPFQNVLNINTGSGNINKISATIYNVVDGKTVYTNQYNNQSGILQMDLSTLPSGVYSLNLMMDGKAKSFKILKK
ncbi:Por secretion system C-terminal sorting domain-containing protein [Mucilaginibacter gossypiicola]|uniref:Por secretion system C-terminal sorting domain-containing protein n=1 Tax=Mucilaginibacter gossypiicola TaxID=551995 RepID=A0A1H8UF12_9SPHI|nr:MBG domain-containing protein [Mucilaginibacter gossypiicola]SEP01751.1 Por secretion system C-terminal sorting domain-containing protein [Mucilaginibacter gossypiicola]